MLFVGNSFDPATPLVSAVNASAGFEGSVVLVQNGYGHCSFGQPSLCTVTAIRKYMRDGTVPVNGTVCEPSAPLFAPPAASNGTVQPRITSREIGDLFEDQKRLDALSRLGNFMGKNGVRG